MNDIPQMTSIEESKFLLKRRDFSIVDRLIGEHIHFVIESQIARGMQLRHKDDDHLLLRIDREPGIEKAAPAVLARGSQFRKRRFDPGHSESQTETLIGPNLSQLILSHE